MLKINEKKGVIFNKKIFQTGGSLATILPQELCQYLETQEGTEIEMNGYEGKHGKYIAIWKKQETQ